MYRYRLFGENYDRVCEELELTTGGEFTMGLQEIDCYLRSCFAFVKKSLRITTKAFDDEIKTLIKEAVEDLARSGIYNIESVMYGRAVVCYVRTYFGERDSSEREKLRQGYEVIKSRLAVTDDELF